MLNIAENKKLTRNFCILDCTLFCSGLFMNVWHFLLCWCLLANLPPSYLDLIPDSLDLPTPPLSPLSLKNFLLNIVQSKKDYYRVFHLAGAGLENLSYVNLLVSRSPHSSCLESFFIESI